MSICIAVVAPRISSGSAAQGEVKGSVPDNHVLGSCRPASSISKRPDLTSSRADATSQVQLRSARVLSVDRSKAAGICYRLPPLRSFVPRPPAAVRGTGINARPRRPPRSFVGSRGSPLDDLPDAPPTAPAATTPVRNAVAQPPQLPHQPPPHPNHHPWP